MNPLEWRHNDNDGVSNHQPHGCLLNRLFRRRSKKTSKLRVTGLCVGNSPGPVNSPHKGPVTRKMFPFDDVIMITTYHSCCFIVMISIKGKSIRRTFTKTYYCVQTVGSSIFPSFGCFMTDNQKQFLNFVILACLPFVKSFPLRFRIFISHLFKRTTKYNKSSLRLQNMTEGLKSKQRMARFDESQQR